MDHLTEWLRIGNAVVAAICQFLAMLVISLGIFRAMVIFLRDVLTPGRSAGAIKESRMELGHSFSLALGFLIGASILKTTLAPTWNDIGQLAAIIAIRTILNYFLLHDINVRSKDSKVGAISGLFGTKPKSPPAEQTDRQQ